MILKDVGHKEVVTAVGEDSLYEASRKMRDNHVGDVVVVKRRNGKLVPIGMLTDRDIVVATLALKVPVETLSVGDVMTFSPVVAREDEPLGRVLNLMKRHGIRRIPLVAKNGDLRGIVAAEDIMQFLARELFSLSEVFSVQRKLEPKRRIKLA
ncbi:MAG: CBS domain-containing protein [Bdellovibrionota bacterium]